MARKPRANAVDGHVGARIRLRRTLLGLSQEKLGQALGLTFQQVQKYERGANRIGSGRLYDLSKVLDVPVSFFFDDLPEAHGGSAGINLSGMSDTPVETFEAEAMSRRETLELVRAYYRIGEPAVRKRVFELVKSMAEPIPGAKRRGRPPGTGRKPPVGAVAPAPVAGDG